MASRAAEHLTGLLRAIPRGSKLTMSNRSCSSALKRLMPVLIRSTPESPGPPGPNTSTPMRCAGSFAWRRAIDRPNVPPPGLSQSNGTCRVVHCDPFTSSGLSLPSGAQSYQCRPFVSTVADAGTTAAPARATPRTTPHVVVLSRRARKLIGASPVWGELLRSSVNGFHRTSGITLDQPLGALGGLVRVQVLRVVDCFALAPPGRAPRGVGDKATMNPASRLRLRLAMHPPGRRHR